MGRSNVAHILRRIDAEQEANQQESTYTDERPFRKDQITSISAQLNEELLMQATPYEDQRKSYIARFNRFLHRASRHFRNGNDRDRKVLGIPDISDQQRKFLRSTTAEGRKMMVDDKLKVARLFQLEQASKPQTPSPFMQKLNTAISFKLAEYLGKKPKNIRQNLTYYSAVDTVVDDFGTDFFYVIDGKAFPEDQDDRIIKFDTTEDPRKTNETSDISNPDTIVINFTNISKKIGLAPKEANFLMAMTISRDYEDGKFATKNQIFIERRNMLINAIADCVIEELHRSNHKKPRQNKIQKRSDLQKIKRPKLLRVS